MTFFPDASQSYKHISTMVALMSTDVISSLPVSSKKHSKSGVKSPIPTLAAVQHSMGDQLARLAGAIIAGDEGNPFAVLGPHLDDKSGVMQIRVFRPDAQKVAVIDSASGVMLCDLPRVHPAGFFASPIAGRHESFAYRLRFSFDGVDWEVEDPYAFGPTLTDLDLYLHAEGNYFRAYEKMGAHPIIKDGVAGVLFAVWAPDARRVSVVGDFNAWDGRVSIMRLRHGAGIWEIFLPGITAGCCYKYEIKTNAGALLLKADPFALAAECPPKTASVVRAALPARKPLNGPPSH
ncbi:MAG: hypothetical protein WCD42_02550, partial [Rhizomicrobium sp.]